MAKTITPGETPDFPLEAPSPAPAEALRELEALANEYVAPALTEADLEKIREAAREKVRKEQYDKMFTHQLEAEMQRARVLAGLSEVAGKEKMVRITMNLPQDMNWLATNSNVYYDGQTYTVPESVAGDLHSRQFAAWLCEARVEGKFLDLKAKRPMINGYEGAGLSMRTGAVTGYTPQMRDAG
jgi:hypothetical protein